VKLEADDKLEEDKWSSGRAQSVGSLVAQVERAGDSQSAATGLRDNCKLPTLGKEFEPERTSKLASPKAEDLLPVELASKRLVPLQQSKSTISAEEHCKKSARFCGPLCPVSSSLEQAGDKAEQLHELASPTGTRSGMSSTSGAKTRPSKRLTSSGLAKQLGAENKEHTVVCTGNTSSGDTIGWPGGQGKVPRPLGERVDTVAARQRLPLGASGQLFVSHIEVVAAANGGKLDGNNFNNRHSQARDLIWHKRQRLSREKWSRLDTLKGSQRIISNSMNGNSNEPRSIVEESPAELRVEGGDHAPRAQRGELVWTPVSGCRLQQRARRATKDCHGVGPACRQRRAMDEGKHGAADSPRATASSKPNGNEITTGANTNSCRNNDEVVDKRRSSSNSPPGDTRQTKGDPQQQQQPPLTRHRASQTPVGQASQASNGNRARRALGELPRVHSCGIDGNNNNKNNNINFDGYDDDDDDDDEHDGHDEDHHEPGNDHELDEKNSRTNGTELTAGTLSGCSKAAEWHRGEKNTDVCKSSLSSSTHANDIHPSNSSTGFLIANYPTGLGLSSTREEAEEVIEQNPSEWRAEFQQEEEAEYPKELGEERSEGKKEEQRRRRNVLTGARCCCCCSSRVSIGQDDKEPHLDLQDSSSDFVSDNRQRLNSGDTFDVLKQTSSPSPSSKQGQLKTNVSPAPSSSVPEVAPIARSSSPESQWSHQTRRRNSRGKSSGEEADGNRSERAEEGKDINRVSSECLGEGEQRLRNNSASNGKMARVNHHQQKLVADFASGSSSTLLSSSIAISSPQQQLDTTTSCCDNKSHNPSRAGSSPPMDPPFGGGGNKRNFSSTGQLTMSGNYRKNSGGGGKRLQLFNSCFCHLICATFGVLFPIFGSFKHYSLPGDMMADLVAGFTIAVLHIPQGMAYGLLAGVEPIYGLYVSFIPVVVMALMSKSRHVSYGTFAVISMLLMNSIDSVRTAIKKSLDQQQNQQQTLRVGQTEPQTKFGLANSLETAKQQQPPDAPALPLVVTDNHQAPPLDSRNQIKSLAEVANEMAVTSMQVPAADHHEVLQYASADILAEQSGQQIANITSNLLASIVATGPNSQSDDPIVSSVDDSGSLSQLVPMVAETAAVMGFQMPSNIEILTCICLVCGLIHITMSLTRLGVLSLMFSDQLVSSFTTASAIHVVTSQLPGLLDLKLAPIQQEVFKLILIWWQFFQKIIYWPPNTAENSELVQLVGPNQVTAMLSLCSIIFLLFIKEFIEPKLRKRFRTFTCLPSELILMAVIIYCSWQWDFAKNYGIRIIGHVPTELPAPKSPRMDILPFVLQDAITIALISFAMNLSLAQVYAKEFKYKLDANQELFALGTANIVGSFFSCFPCASSLSRSSVQSSLNVRSQLCSLFSSAIVLVIICYAAPVLHHLPRSTLSCIIVVALKGILMQMKDFCTNWKLSKLDALVWLTTFTAVIVFGVTYGLFIGIVASLFMIFYRLLTPNHSILGQLAGTDIYVDVGAFGDCEEIERTKIFRFNSPLCYLNRTMLRSRVEKCLPNIYKPTGFNAICAKFHNDSTACHSARPSSSASSSCRTSFDHTNEQSIEYLIIDCSALAYCDCSGVATLVELTEELAEHNVSVYLAACSLKMIDILERMDKSLIIKQNCFPTIVDAIGQIRYLRNFEIRPGYQTKREKFDTN